MKLVAMTVFDVKAAVYLPPFYARTVHEGMRTFAQMVNDGQSPFWRWPSDYTLMECGQFEEETGVLTPAPLHEYGNGQNYKEPAQ